MVGIEFEFYEAVYIWIIKEDRGFCSVISLMYVLIFLLELKIWSEYGKNIYIYIYLGIIIFCYCLYLGCFYYWIIVLCNMYIGMFYCWRIICEM